MMDVERVKCTECDAMILPETAGKYGGMCAHCGDTPEWIRKERRQYQSNLASGDIFAPSEAELASAKVPPEFAMSETQWGLEPDYYSDGATNSVLDAINQAKSKAKGNVFLVSDSGSRLNLSFTEDFGVCEYQNEEADDFLYAYSQYNLRNQVPKVRHVVQACPCCGEGMLWFPSRFHMPRELAFDIIASLASNKNPGDIKWLGSGDFSWTSQGKG